MQKHRLPDVPDAIPKGLEKPAIKKELFTYDERRNAEAWGKLKPSPDPEQTVLEVVLLGQFEPLHNKSPQRHYRALDISAVTRMPTSKAFDSRLKPGTYWLAAQFTGSIGTDNRVIFIAGGPNQPANMVSPEPGLGATTPISNTLQFEIPSR
jgi:hypothetical protein